MSNQSFLVCSEKRLVYPSFHERSFSTKQQVIACGDWFVPSLWLALFRETELRDFDIPHADGMSATTAPIVHRRFIAGRLQSAVAILESTFRQVNTWRLHAELFLESIERATEKRPYVSIEWNQISVLAPTAVEFKKAMRWQMRFFAGQRVQRPAKKLADLTNVRWNGKFPDPRTATLSDLDEKNLAGLLGSNYERSVAWWPAPAVVKQKQRVRKREAKRIDGTSDLKVSLREAIEKRSIACVKSLLKDVRDFSDPAFSELLDAAVQDQTYKKPTKIPELLIKKGVKVSQEAFAAAATEACTYAQFKAMLESGSIDPAAKSKTLLSRITAPPAFWVCCDNVLRRDAALAARKLKLLIDRNVSVDVKDSTGTWLLELCVGAPGCLRLVLPRASRTHRLAALRYALGRGLPSRASEQDVDRLTKYLIDFVRAIHKSGIKEASDADKQIRANRDAWQHESLEPYPYR